MEQSYARLLSGRDIVRQPRLARDEKVCREQLMLIGEV